jgi:hypothetical protein
MTPPLSGCRTMPPTPQLHTVTSCHLERDRQTKPATANATATGSGFRSYVWSPETAPFPGVGRNVSEELEYDGIEYAALPVNTTVLERFAWWHSVAAKASDGSVTLVVRMNGCRLPRLMPNVPDALSRNVVWITVIRVPGVTWSWETRVVFFAAVVCRARWLSRPARCRVGGVVGEVDVMVWSAVWGWGWAPGCGWRLRVGRRRCAACARVRRRRRGA